MIRGKIPHVRKTTLRRCSPCATRSVRGRAGLFRGRVRARRLRRYGDLRAARVQRRRRAGFHRPAVRGRGRPVHQLAAYAPCAPTRGQGYGDLIMRMLLFRAQELHAPGIYIHSQAPVAHFLRALRLPAHRQNRIRRGRGAHPALCQGGGYLPGGLLRPVRERIPRGEISGAVHRPAARDFPREAR